MMVVVVAVHVVTFLGRVGGPFGKVSGIQRGPAKIMICPKSHIFTAQDF